MTIMTYDEMVDIIVEMLDEIDAYRKETDEDKSKELLMNIMILEDMYFGDIRDEMLEEEWRTGKKYIDILEEMCEEELDGLVYNRQDLVQE